MKIIGSKWQFLTLPNICHLHVYLVYTFICYLHPLIVVTYKGSAGALDKAQRFFYICPFFSLIGLAAKICSPFFCDHIFRHWHTSLWVLQSQGGPCNFRVLSLFSFHSKSSVFTDSFSFLDRCRFYLGKTMKDKKV